MRNNFPLEFQKVLVLKQTNYAHLSKAMARRGFRVTKQFLSQMGIGQRNVPPQLLRKVCETLELDAQEKHVLSRAACIDAGYELQ